MTRKPPPGLFVTGTSTEVGKTYVAALIARSLFERGVRVGVYKPAASGCRVAVEAGREEIISDDAATLWQAAGRPGALHDVCPQRFLAPLAPHLAARAEGKVIDAKLLRTGIDVWRAQCDFILVEGAGGLMSPLGDDEFVADLAHDFGYPMIVVAANQLGVINHTLQTLITASVFRDGLEVAGVILNDVGPPNESPSTTQPRDVSVTSNRQELERLCVPPVLAHVKWNAQRFEEKIDWRNVADTLRVS